jgi:hypothetical protein
MGTRSRPIRNRIKAPDVGGEAVYASSVSSEEGADADCSSDVPKGFYFYFYKSNAIGQYN